ncbi:cation:proton antiporter [Endozoicomonas numazuensis]|uniref:Sodium:hydrogen antiporter n=1 Tax=Endozoicomonas numazuensis TaxID=1137799 RepID=A0A081N9F1_9GAMM|nr:cation:proton antiporter [Endozoicomonas numazuensis]KEQ15074.1 sodium:hydrogen antiporter [Endozoicomonas numazuensis]
MESGSLLFSFFLIFSGAAVLATAALFTRQPLLVAYIVLGAFLGPYGMEMVTDTGLLNDIAHVGIIFLLFLLGLDMQPSHLGHLLKKTATVGLISSIIFALTGYGLGLAFGFTQKEAIITGATMMFSSTIIGIKLLPTTVLHHKHTGEILVSLLLLQDLLAILVLLLLYNFDGGFANSKMDVLMALAALPMIIAAAFLAVRYALLPLMARFDRFHEYMFLLAIGWCLGFAELAHALNLSYEIGAFIAGVSIATSPISQYIAINLKPLRDFFLVLFFFSIGASFNLSLFDEVWLPAMVMTAICLILKPTTFGVLLRANEKKSTAWEVGFRLGQTSEFSILIAVLAAGQMLMGEIAAHVVQATAILTLIISSYIVVFNYESPIAVSEKLRRD